MVLLTALLALIVSGCWHHRTPEKRAGHIVERLVTTLKLDAAQTAKLEKIKEEFLARRPDMVKMREESFKDVKEMMLSPQLDQARLNARKEKIQAHTDDMIQFVSAKFAELHDLLTPEQRSKLVEEMEKHAQRRHHW
jgi:Spy/CpxP family protein refolding chaperone